MANADDPQKSPLRDLMAEAADITYVAFETLDSAKTDPDGVVVLEGDDGGQLYVVVPARRVFCSEEALGQLLRDLDAINWPGNDDDMARVVYERRLIGAPVAGGMGGAVVGSNAWIHPEVERLGLGDEIRAIIGAKSERLSVESRAKRRP